MARTSPCPAATASPCSPRASTSPPASPSASRRGSSRCWWSSPAPACPAAATTTQLPPFGGRFSPTNPFTPDLLIFDQNGHQDRRPPGQAHPRRRRLPAGRPRHRSRLRERHAGRHPLRHRLEPGRSRRAGKLEQHLARSCSVDPSSGAVTPVVSGLPTGDHPTEQLIVKDGWLYWSQGSATNAGVTGHDNGGGGNQHDIACEDVVLSQNVWSSGDGHFTSGYSNHGVHAPGRARAGVRERHRSAACAPAPSCGRSIRHDAGRTPSSRSRGATATRTGCASRPRTTPEGRALRDRERRGRARRAADQQRSRSPATRAAESPAGGPTITAGPTASASSTPPRRCSTRWAAPATTCPRRLCSPWTCRCARARLRAAAAGGAARLEPADVAAVGRTSRPTRSPAGRAEGRGPGVARGRLRVLARGTASPRKATTSAGQLQRSARSAASRALALRLQLPAGRPGLRPGRHATCTDPATGVHRRDPRHQPAAAGPVRA